MWKAYKYIYYWLYSWQKKLWGENDVPEFNAISGMSLSLIGYLCSIAIILEITTGIQMISPLYTKIELLVFGFFVLGLHYFLFIFRGKYRKIEEEFKDESKVERRQKAKWVLLYAFGSFVLYIFLLFFGIWIENGD